jgi:ribokinase
MQGDKFDLVVLGGANWDYTVQGPHLPSRSQTVEGTAFYEGPGGKGANQAVAAARLGARVAFIGCVGSDERGDKIRANFQREGIDTTWLRRSKTGATGVALIMVDSQGGKQIITAPGANRELCLQDITSAEALITQAKVLVSQFEVPIEVLSLAIKTAKNAGVSVALDPAPPVGLLPADFLQGIALIKPNADEAEALTGVKVSDRRTAKIAAELLLKRGVQAVVIEAGNEGNLLLTAGEEIFFPHLEVLCVDATGAGDAFMGGMAVSLAGGRNLEEAVRFGQGTLALKLGGVGAQAPLPTRLEVEHFLQGGV